uniref:DUF3237 domain-containing protein n=1 Tax=Globodera pallida TaxID=36090 RepID=A0A183C413_GLOPA
MLEENDKGPTTSGANFLLIRNGPGEGVLECLPFAVGLLIRGDRPTAGGWVSHRLALSINGDEGCLTAGGWVSHRLALSINGDEDCPTAGGWVSHRLAPDWRESALEDACSSMVDDAADPVTTFFAERDL